MRREPNIHSAPAKNSPCLSVNNPTDGDDLKLRFGVCHIIGVIEPHLTAAHADALTVDKHVETIFIHHGLSITLMDGLVLHIIQKSVCVGKLSAVDRNGITDHIGYCIPVFIQIGRPNSKASSFTTISASKAKQN